MTMLLKTNRKLLRISKVVRVFSGVPMKQVGLQLPNPTSIVGTVVREKITTIVGAIKLLTT